MHATIEQLLSARDGAVQEATLARHIAECPRCRAALADLVALREGRPLEGVVDKRIGF